MNFYQKILSLITLAVMGLTVAVIFVCFQSPYSDLFITESAAILWGELLAGFTFVMLCRKKDSMLPYSLAVAWISIAYLIFTFIMVIPAMFDMQLKYFILIHAAGLTFAGIGYGFFLLGEHNIREQEKCDAALQQNRKDFSSQMHSITNEMRDVFPDRSSLVRASEKLADDLHFCACSRPGLENADCDMERILSALQNAVSSADAAECEQYLKLLKRKYQFREEQAKSL